MGRRHLILASKSPRRLELLGRLGVSPDSVVPAEIDETPFKNELPKGYVLRLAREKALSIPTDNYVLSGDTVVSIGRRILPKAENISTARQCIEALSGRRHRVMTAVALKLPDQSLLQKFSETLVRFKRLHPKEIDYYLETEEWQGKAGGYAVQGFAESLIARIDGSHSCVMGLPLFETRALLKAAGFSVG